MQSRDADIDQNANVTYRLVERSGAASNFRISFLYGTVTTASDLSDVNYDEFEIRLVIADNGSPPEQDSLQFVIIVDSRVAYEGGGSGGGQEAPLADASDDDGGSSSSATITAVVVVLCVFVLLVVGIIAGIVLMRRKKKPKQQQKLDDTPYDAERKDLKGVDGPFTLSDSLVSTSKFMQHVLL